MTTPLLIALGVVLGALGSVGHLWVTYTRAQWVRRGRSRLALATLPVAILIPVAAFFVALQLSPVAAWSMLLGLIVTQSMVLWRMGNAT